MGDLLSAWFCSTSGFIDFGVTTNGGDLMEALRKANDGLIAENQSLREELELSRLQYNRLLNDHNKCLRRASELQVANQDLGKRLTAVKEAIA